MRRAPSHSTTTTIDNLRNGKKGATTIDNLRNGKKEGRNRKKT